MADAPYELYDTETAHFFWWQNSPTTFCAARGGLDPSEIYMSTDIPDALEQAGYDRENPNGVVHQNNAPDFEFEQF